MAEAELEFRNILVIDFGQLGDVVLSLPALKAIRGRFPRGRITLLIGKPGADIVRVAGVSDEQILVDRVELRDSNKFWSIHQIYKLVRNIRRHKFDLVIDLHSLYETNICGYLSGAKYRLYANRHRRSLDRLANFPKRPPPEDKLKHLTDRYFDVLQPLGIVPNGRDLRVSPPVENMVEAKRLFSENGITGKRAIGLFVGAGHPGRRWPLVKFAELARRLIADSGKAVIVFLGPEEKHLVEDVLNLFLPEVTVFDTLRLLTFMAAASKLDVFVTNDTGPMHIAAVAGAPIVMISHPGAPDVYYPLTDKFRALNEHATMEFSVEEVLTATLEMMARYPS